MAKHANILKVEDRSFELFEDISMLIFPSRPPGIGDDERTDRVVDNKQAEDRAMSNFQQALVAVKRAMNRLAKGHDKR